MRDSVVVVRLLFLAVMLLSGCGENPVGPTQGREIPACVRVGQVIRLADDVYLICG